MSIESVMPSNHLILCYPLLLSPSIFPNIKVFSNESGLRIRWPSIPVSASAAVLPNEYSSLIPFRIDWKDLLQSKGLSSVFSNITVQKHQFSAFFIVQLSHPYLTIGKTIALTRWTFVGKEIAVLFTMLSRLAITFLPRRKHLLNSWLQSPSAVILEPKKRKCLTVSTVSSSICHDGTRCHDLTFLNVEF